MSEVMENVRAHFASKQRKEHFIEQWDVTVYASPLSIKRYDHIGKLRKEYPVAEALVRTLVFIAENEDGEKMFNKADISVLLRAGDLRAIASAVTALTADSETDIDTLESD